MPRVRMNMVGMGICLGDPAPVVPNVVLCAKDKETLQIFLSMLEVNEEAKAYFDAALQDMKVDLRLE